MLICVIHVRSELDAALSAWSPPWLKRIGVPLLPATDTSPSLVPALAGKVFLILHVLRVLPPL